MTGAIRPMDVRDAAKVAELTGQLGYPVTEAELRDRLATALAASTDHRLLVAVDTEDVPIGWAHVERLRLLELPPAAQLAGLVVSEQHRSAGIGAALLENAEATASRWGCRSLRVRSNVIRERAHRFYERAGYRRIKTSYTFEKELGPSAPPSAQQPANELQGVRAFYRGLPAKRIGAGVLFTDDLGRVLLVRPTYKQPWEIPGGLVEEGESPHEAATREVTEETGLDRPAGRLLCVDWVPPRDPKTDGLMLLFDGGVLAPAEVAAIVLPPDELSEHRFVDLNDFQDYVPERMARRLVAGLAARGDGIPRYLVDGRAPRADR
ncbi:MAG: GNAT family N-acetyltransferase [Chloroflexi bacterium]|nr:GNAT family N-acetyltransferase [Chloroflexota bacterium]